MGVTVVHRVWMMCVMTLLFLHRCNNNHFLKAGRLLQEYAIDLHCMVEQQRLNWVRYNQKALRAELYSGLADAIHAHDAPADITGATIGKPYILPSSFTGGPRYQQQGYQDSMALVRKLGKPDLFVTFTCNPTWPEIKNELGNGEQANDRPDLIARVFNLKVGQLRSNLQLHL